MSEAIALKEVSKVFENGTVALSNINLSIQQGEFVALLGASGCGKSTLLRLIGEIEPPSTGNIAIDDGSTEGDRTKRGCVFQQPTLMPWATVFNNVYAPLRIAGMDKNKARPKIETALKRVGLAESIDLYPRQLSGGMQMRVSIARALVGNPSILLMDEPFAALDEITRFQLNDDLLALWEEHRFTAVFVTHSIYEACYLADRIVVMGASPGRIAGELRMEGDRPRPSDFRVSAEYLNLCQDASRMLQDAMEPTYS